jgi:quercetin dioxygenase-like cupin family protein
MKIVQTRKTVTSAESGQFSATTWHQRGREEWTDDDPYRPSLVHFPPGVRTHWHRHAGGQVLYIVSGQARVGVRGEMHELQAGELLVADPDEWHWHGAAPHSFMSHLSVIREATEWGDAVSTEDYEGSAGS